MPDLGLAVSIMLEGLALSEQTMRCSFAWAGDEYACVGGPEFGTRLLDEGGYKIRAGCKITVRTSLLPPGVGYPAARQTVLYKRAANADPKQYRIETVDNYFDAYLILHCVDPNQNI
jgi:hypothetical protein